MKFQSWFILAFTLIPGFCLMETVNADEWGKCKDVFEPEVKEHVLLNHVFQLVLVSEEDLCQVECKLKDDCVSYNTGPSKEAPGWFDCDLNESDRYLCPQDFKPKAGFSYRGKKNPCKSNPCKGPKSVCERSGYDYSKHTCLCPKGFTGENCQEDIDECAYSCMNNCTLENPGVKCENTPGSFQCACAEGYEGDGITCQETASWKKINNDSVCIGVKDNNYGEVIVPFDANVKQFKLVHLSGAVSGRNDPVTARNWGDKTYPQDLLFVVTDENKKIIAPHPGYPMPGKIYFAIDNITVSSPELIFPTSDSPLLLKKGKKIRIWFTYDMYDLYENTMFGSTCADLYIHS